MKEHFAPEGSINMFNLKNFLKQEVKPALGCTEPGAVALAVARACEELSDRQDIASVRAVVSGSIYKNGMAVGIPGTRGARGNAIAAALGAICGKAANGLEVLKDSSREDVAKAEQWVRDERATIYCDPDRTGVYVMATVFTPEHKAVCLIEGGHSNIVKVALDGKIVFEATRGEEDAASAVNELPETFAETLEAVSQLDGEDERFLLEGVRMNMAIAESGFKSSEDCAACGECAQGSRFGRSLRGFMEEGRLARDPANEIRSVASAAADARMSGVLLPVMSSAGSGNHGITAILPVAIFGKSRQKSDGEIARALAVSHLVTSYVKRSIGRLSPVCGCAVAAGSGAAAGITSLLGGGAREIEDAVALMLANLAGMLCDGAKESCALKVGSAAAEAYLAANWAVSGESLMPQGLIGGTIEETVKNIGLINREGLKTVDRLIIGILDERHRPEPAI